MVELLCEAALAQDIGSRARQEDAAIAHFASGAPGGIAVLSDGMGGHDDGDLAGRIIAAEMFAELYLSAARKDVLRFDCKAIFGSALGSANRKLQHHIDQGHLSGDTGGTLLSVIVTDGTLRWISVGDSPLWLLRGGRLTRLNEVHSLAPQIDLMVAAGEIDADTALAGGGRNCLTSAVTGGDIARIDCPEEGLPLCAGDLLLLASDGVETLDETTLRGLLQRRRHAPAQQIADALIGAVRRRAGPDQDNSSVVVIRMRAATGVRAVLRGWIAGLLDRVLRAPAPMLAPVVAERAS
ncbi:SpoIIE family protein phosphatase [Salipiger sp. 1_MG-2023]|uniref:PP2C family protein-serine/threonine phosphatase n=1 Tax=Salipiger sp. 1_MG-2023 TaxID=3062665 RepID=UPI0026E37EBC|nr:SpoIIE family protein phosphatase [Salipiger sp. 1_MG-2023]MDO6588393.1 SpoIIE family protein phosphatase [Salipiger sp. 1_MG-2023]